MSIFSKKVFDSDLDAYKNSGEILNVPVVVSGGLAGGGGGTFEQTVTVEDPDFFQILFDNSVMHSGKFKVMAIEGSSLINEVTFGSQLTFWMYVRIQGNQITLGGQMMNPYSSGVTLQTTTVNFRLIPYEGTI